MCLLSACCRHVNNLLKTQREKLFGTIHNVEVKSTSDTSLSHMLHFLVYFAPTDSPRGGDRHKLGVGGKEIKHSVFVDIAQR